MLEVCERLHDRFEVQFTPEDLRCHAVVSSTR
jgi:hypothetical protein